MLNVRRRLGFVREARLRVIRNCPVIGFRAKRGNKTFLNSCMSAGFDIHWWNALIYMCGNTSGKTKKLVWFRRIYRSFHRRLICRDLFLGDHCTRNYPTRDYATIYHPAGCLFGGIKLARASCLRQDITSTTPGLVIVLG